MTRRGNARDLQSVLVRLVRNDPRWLILVLVIAGVLLLLDRFQQPTTGVSREAPPVSEDGYLFCCWNVENLFDDLDDPKNHDPLDAWFANDPNALRHKHELLADVLVGLNGGRGPDVLALVEIENLRAVELLRDALNQRLSTEWHYTEIVHEDNIGGRRIEPAVLTRLPVDTSATRTFPSRRRIIGARLVVEGKPLDILVAHWTSRLTDQDGAKRLAYAQEMYESYLSIENESSELADVLICGDFNDEPDDESVRLGLRATGDVSTVIASAGMKQPRLLNLMAGRDPEEFGTYRYRNRWQILDHLVASPGLLDSENWTVVVDTLQTVNGLPLQDGRGGPLRFGNAENQNPRGPSDHFALCVRILPPGFDPATGSQDIALNP